MLPCVNSRDVGERWSVHQFLTKNELCRAASQSAHLYCSNDADVWNLNSNDTCICYALVSKRMRIAWLFTLSSYMLRWFMTKKTWLEKENTDQMNPIVIWCWKQWNCIVVKVEHVLFFLGSPGLLQTRAELLDFTRGRFNPFIYFSRWLRGILSKILHV